MGKQTTYSLALKEKVDTKLPQKVKDAMNICGWNALGIYELVRDEIKTERRDAKKEAEAL